MIAAAWGIAGRGARADRADPRDARDGDRHGRGDQAARGTASEEVTLPGNIQPFTDAAIFARTTGYLKKRYADIGSRVKAGQMLAEIDTPEIDQQLPQARADLATAQANATLAQTTADRYQDLIKTDSVSRQDLDNATGTYDARKAAVLSADANVKRLEELQKFKTIYAPFDGVITARNTDIGALIGSGSAREGAVPHRVDDRLRIFVNVPQIYSRRGAAGDGGGHRDPEPARAHLQGTPRRGRRSRSIRPRARCWRRSISTTRAARSCRARSRRCTSSCRPTPPRSGCR